MLLKGEELPNQMVVDMIESKLKSSEVQHYGEPSFQVYAYTSTYRYVHTYVHVYIRTYIYVRTYIHTYVLTLVY